MDLQNNNQTNTTGVTRGRPRISNFIDRDQNSQMQESNSNQQQFWYQSIETTKIIIILASKCQILFKCIGGKSANKIKNNPFWSNSKIQVSFLKFKNSRKAFAKTARKLQNELLKKLEQHLEIKLIGEEGNMNYFFFGQNNVTYTQQKQKEIMNLLNPFIHQDFKETLIELLELPNESSNDNFEKSRLDDLYNIQKHKHFVSWAFIISWGKTIRNHLTLLQEELTNNNQPKKLMKKSGKIQKKKQKEIQQDIVTLICNYEKDYKEEINDIIKLFRQRIQNNNY